MLRRLGVAAFISAAAITGTTLSSCGSGTKATSGGGSAYYAGPALDTLTSNPNRLVTIETSQGIIKLQLFDKIAPKHVANFVSLIKSGFYNGVTFHRVIPGFMIQGGDPNSKDDNLENDGIGQPGLTKVPAEFSKLRHEPGILSAARTQDPNSATSQFFIVHKRASSLDGQYSIFGQVFEGLDVVEKIVNLPRNKSDNPGKAALITRVTISE